MSAKSLIIWSLAAVFGLSALTMLSPKAAPVASLETGLGPEVSTEAL